MKPFCTLISLAFFAVTVLPGIGFAETTSTAIGEDGVKARITVDPEKIIGKVNPLVFGHGIEAAKIPGWKENQAIETGRGLWNPQTRAPMKTGVEISKEIGVKMLRYPGGALVEGFDWKEAAGPLSERPDKDWTFGVDEFLTLCKELGAEPLMQVSYYTGTPQDAANLVKYLNGPASSDDPWVKKRIQAGHPDPYGVKYFEYGNETDLRGASPADYAEKFNETVKQMKAVDPDIKVSAHLASLSLIPSHPWNRAVIEKVKDTADFLVIHFYFGGMGRDTDVTFRGSMAAGDQVERYLNEYNRVIQNTAGKSIPLAITEYNTGHIEKGEGRTHRFSLAAGLFNADLLRIFLKPENHVGFANYWQYLHGYWGVVHGPRVPGDKKEWNRLAPFYCYRLWTRHFGDKLVDVSVDGPTLTFEGARNVEPAGLQKETYKRSVPFTLESSTGEGFKITPTGRDSLVVELTNLLKTDYPGFGQAKAEPHKTYVLTGEVKKDKSQNPLVNTTIGIGLLDSRGWEQTFTGCAVEGLDGLDTWAKFETEPMTMTEGCTSLSLIMRLKFHTILGTTTYPEKNGTSEFHIRNIRVQEISNAFPAYPALTASASLSKDGKTLYLIVFNKHHTDAIKTAIDIKDNSLRAAKCWTVSGASFAATNLEKKEIWEVRADPSAEDLRPSGFVYTFPPRSMNAVEITRK